MKSIKTALRIYLIYLISLLIIWVCTFFYFLPAAIFADNPEDLKDLSSGSFSGNYSDSSMIFSEMKSSDVDSNFLPVIITSVVVLGILVFAMWQTIKSKRMY